MLFLDEHYRALHRDLDRIASCAVATLRIATGEHPGDPGLSALVGDLAVRSDRFAELWAGHPVASHGYGTRRLRHPEVGDLELEQENVALADGSGHVLMMHSAAPDSPSHHALQLLRMRAADDNARH
ncbi:MmyB family transcriptional regulator [Streptodolium elevatio]|uniref:MmyB-like transcription regulator ligand binding domain-containing protein n=1 Tax=Streptodolium elevatio TaxID=3157996 RepID=A0ABV3DL87_9ACTN